jgi:diguanylate cyclase (GGDEF)-like protein
VFNMYFLGLACTCLRHDARLCVAAGLTAMVQYAGIVLWAVKGWDLGGPLFAHSSYGAFRWDNQIARLLLLAIATAVNTVIVVHNRGYLRASLYDPLTGLPNRRYAQVYLHQALFMARRTRRSMVLALADLDRFKQVNDRYGHAAGDEVLRHTGAILRQAFRGSDVVARYGGEEFLILLPEAETAPALERLQHFASAFAASPARPAASIHPLPMTLSLGVAAFPADGETVVELLDRADQRLYGAKQAGRNRLEGP